MKATLYCGDCLEVLPTLSGPFDAIITRGFRGSLSTRVSSGMSGKALLGWQDGLHRSYR